MNYDPDLTIIPASDFDYEPIRGDLVHFHRWGHDRIEMTLTERDCWKSIAQGMIQHVSALTREALRHIRGTLEYYRITDEAIYVADAYQFVKTWWLDGDYWASAEEIDRRRAADYGTED